MDEARAHERRAGPDGHRLVGLERSIDRVHRQAVECVAVAVGSPVIAWFDLRVGLAVAGSAAAAAAVLTAGMGVLATARRRCVHEVVLSGHAVECEAFANEVRRLQDRQHRERLASVLERALSDGRKWGQLMPASRPPPGARYLPEHETTIVAIVAGLRRDGASPRAVVLVERLVGGGYGSSLYAAHAEWLRRELGRIRFELDVTRRD
jgi:hypothetical protein